MRNNKEVGNLQTLLSFRQIGRCEMSLGNGREHSSVDKGARSLFITTLVAVLTFRGQKQWRRGGRTVTILHRKCSDRKDEGNQNGYE